MSNLFLNLLKKLKIIKSKEETNNNYNHNNYSNIDINNNNFKNMNSDIINKNDSNNNTSDFKKNINYNDNLEINKNNYSKKISDNYNAILESQTIEKQTQLKHQTENIDTTKIYEEVRISYDKINTIWNILKIKENTQAEHIISCLPQDQWIDMDELRQRIKLQFNIEYKNEKSLYPYVKTLTDINLIKVNNIGKKRTWKKNIIIIEKK